MAVHWPSHPVETGDPVTYSFADSTGSATSGKPTQLSGWGNSHRSTCNIISPLTREDLIESLSSSSQKRLIGRGCGRSYGDQSTLDHGQVVDLTELSTIDSFDSETGEVVCEAGVTIGEIVDRYAEKGFVPAVCPGTGFVTVGGAIANDVHGKNHYSEGSFADSVGWLELLLPTGDLVTLSRDDNPSLFRATIGGIGLTGLIVRASVRLARVRSSNVRVTERRMSDVVQFMEELEFRRKSAPHAVGWIDATARGDALGRGILSYAEPCEEKVKTQVRRNITVPFRLPQGLLNRHFVKLFNTVYLNRVRSSRQRIQNFRRFAFPLDSLLRWNRLYGRRGVYQFQCVVPFETASAVIPELMRAATTSSHLSPLAVIKTLSREGQGFLSFPRPGFTLALDFPRTEDTHRLISRMYDIVIHSGGRAYLAKDACLQVGQFREMYPHFEEFLNIISAVDPARQMTSDMASRLGLHN